MKKKIIALAAVAMMTFTACAGGGQPAGGATEPSAADAADGSADSPAGNLTEVTIPHYKVGDNVGSIYFIPLVDSFNERYEGRFRLNIEPMPQNMYPEQLRQLAAQGMLPPLIEGDLDIVWFQEFIIAGNRFVDLWPVFENHPIAPYLNPDNVKFNTSDDGRLITVPQPILRAIQFFYNQDLWQPSRPVRDMSWRELAADLNGERIAFMTAENAWTTMLILSSLIAVEPGGQELLMDGIHERITDFSHPALVSAFGELQYLMQNHAQPNAIGAPYAEAANSFFNLGSAIIANGSWMIGDFRPEGSDNWGPDFNPESITSDVYPGNVAIANPLGHTWWISSTSSEEEIELAKAFLSFYFEPEQLEFIMLQTGGSVPGLTHSEEFLQARAEDRIMDVYMGAVDGNTIITPAFENAIFSSIANNDLGVLLPLLADGTLTPEGFAEELTRRTADATF